MPIAYIYPDSTVVEHDYGTLPNLGHSTGSYYTGSNGLLL